jgi:hypothetical protein
MAETTAVSFYQQELEQTRNAYHDLRAQLAERDAELAAYRNALGDVEALAGTLAVSAAALAELARMVRTNQAKVDDGRADHT